jgi:predicted nucleic acid-binding protein
VKLVDANLLLYATDERSPRHLAARSWLDRVLSGE